MNIGDWELTSVMAGRFGLDGGAMFGVVPRVMWEKLLPPDSANRIPMVMRLLVARAHERTVLVDVGAGSGYSARHAEIYALEETDHLVDTLSAAGIAAESVTDVMLTHLHFDHGAGIVAPGAEGWELLFPRARHHVQRTQWGHALSPNPRDRASYYVDRLQVMEDEGVLELHNGDWTLAPGFDLRVFDGHTPGQQLPLITGGDETLFYTGDLIPTRHHIPTPYVMSYDLDPVLTMNEKTPLIEEAYEGRWILFFEHDAHVEACRIEREGRRYHPGAALTL